LISEKIEKFGKFLFFAEFVNLVLCLRKYLGKFRKLEIGMTFFSDEFLKIWEIWDFATTDEN
jgi:hypothetical protein